MLNCAYCDQPCQPTREHVIPRWYNDTPGEAETFSARAPITHLKGDLIVKDVCNVCNSGALSKLDAYGKELYQRYFASPVYANETVDFAYDGERLIRWLLKLSFNSARAQNADIGVLCEYRKLILGESPLTEQIRCWLHLVPPSYLKGTEQPRPAKREEQNDPDVEEAAWFRIGQFRLPSYPALMLVQRIVYINSFAFTLLVAGVDADWPCEEFSEWISLFSHAYPAAKPILPERGSVSVTTGAEHAAETFIWTQRNYPSRYADVTSPLLVAATKGEAGRLLLHIPHELVEDGETAPIAEILQDMVGTREQAMAYKQRISVMVTGYDDDPRGLWQIPKSRDFLRQLFLECPFVMLLSHPEGSLVRLLAACWLYEDDLTEDVQKSRMKEFLERAFQGLNDLTHKLALSEEVNREVCMAAKRTLFNEVPDSA